MRFLRAGRTDVAWRLRLKRGVRRVVVAVVVEVPERGRWERRAREREPNIVSLRECM